MPWLDMLSTGLLQEGRVNIKELLFHVQNTS